jgi:hypothetical protein
MAAPRAQTLQERFGFKDDDLKQKSHDDIMLWVHNNAYSVLKHLMVRTGVLKSIDAAWAENRSLLQETLEKYGKISVCNAELRGTPLSWEVESGTWNYLESVPQERPSIRIDSKKWEHPIKAKGGFMIGFVDLVITYRYPFIGGTKFRATDNDGGGWIQYRRRKLACEIKTTLPTAGELIRQIRMYQEHSNDDTAWMVICPDDRHASILEAQGIYFYKSPQ